MTDDKPWRDEELMRKLYHEKRMSQREISDHFDNEVTPGGIGYCLDELGIEKRSRGEAAKIRWLKHPPNIHLDAGGYEYCKTETDGEEYHVLLHRLLAVSEFGFDAVTGKDVHHNAPEADRSWGIPWDNRPDVIELLTEEEHTQIHQTGHNDDEPWHDVDRLRELRVEKEMTLEQVGGELGCSHQTIRRSLEKYDVEGTEV